MTRDSFINELASSSIRQRLLEKDYLSLLQAYELADSLDHAISISRTASLSATTADVALESAEEEALSSNFTSAATIRKRSCLYCGGKPHSRRSQCPARNSNCYACGKRDHYSRVCRSVTPRKSTDGPNRSKIAATTRSRSLLASAPSGLAIVKGSLEGNPVHVLIDSGASENFVDTDIVRKLGLPLAGRATSIGMVSSGVSMQTLGRVSGVLSLMDRQYPNASFHVMPKLLT